MDRGLAEAANGRHPVALSIFESVIAVQPDSGPAYREAGSQAMILGDHALALDYLQLAMHYLPTDRAARLSFVRACLNAGRADSALACVDALQTDFPVDGEIAFERARCLYMTGAFSAAVNCLEQYLSQEPDDAVALNFLGLILARDLGDLDGGERVMRRALEVRPGFVAAMSNLGWILAESGQLSEAMVFFDRVLERSPDDAETRLMRAQARLKRGMFREGWQDFSARHLSPLAIRRPALLPSPPANLHVFRKSRLLVLSEQGIGDQIMFASCIPDLLASGHQVTLECHWQLQGVFARSFPACTVVSDKAPASAEALRVGHEFELFVGDLPGMFRNVLDDFPNRSGYLVADPDRTAYWRARLEALAPGPYVGISWRGGTRATRRQLRSIEPREWMPILELPGCHVSLQYGDCKDDLTAFHELGARVHHWPAAIENYEDTAALIAALDVVVSVCTAVVHLSGALGKAVHVLTPAQAEWRYLDRGARLPWYSSVVLHRQERAGDWGSVIRNVAATVAQCR